MKFLKIKKSEKGFSIIELLIAIPLTTIILVILISVLFTQYTNSLAESARTNLRTAGQTLLINLQDELLFTIAYGEQLDVGLVDPNEPSGGWRYDSSPFPTLIINEIALDSTRRDEDRNIVRQRIVPNCESSSISANPVALNNVIYFVEKSADDRFGTLKKRTIIPEYNLCSIDSVTDGPCTPVTSTCRDNAKETSCPLAAVGTNNCTRAESTLTENVVDMQIQYFAEDNVPTSFPSAADKVEIVLTLGDTVYGKDVEAEIKHTIRKIN